MGATFCHLAARRSAIEFLFWDHWETAVLVQIPAGRSREVTGANVCHLAALRPPIELLFRNGRFGPNPGPEVTGGHGRSWEVTGGYGGGKRRKVEERHEKGWKETKENEGKSLKAQGKWRKMEELRSSTESCAVLRGFRGFRGSLCLRGWASQTLGQSFNGFKLRDWASHTLWQSFNSFKGFRGFRVLGV